MLDLKNEIEQFIEEGIPLNKISSLLDIPNRTLYKYINLIDKEENKLKRLYYSTGDIVYRKPTCKENIPNNGVNIITTEEENKLSLVAISDVHLGSNFARIDLLKKIYEYCEKENIHIVLNGGDIIDGKFSREPQKIPLVIDQVEYFLKNYPYSKNILTFTVLGDHDYCAYNNPLGGFEKILNTYRHDIIPLGYAQGRINIKNEFIILKHFIKNYPRVEVSCNLILKGHSHYYKLSSNGHDCIAILPSLSNLNFKPGSTTNLALPSALQITLYFNNNIFSQIDINQLIIADKIYTVNEINLNIASSKKGDFNNIINYDINTITPKKVLKPNHPTGLERFNKRYNNN